MNKYIKELEKVTLNEKKSIEDYKKALLTISNKNQINYQADIIDAFEKSRINLVKEIRQNKGISYRKAMILAFTKRLAAESNKRYLYKIGSIHNLAVQTYKINNRDKKRWNSLDKIYPEDPCQFYEEKEFERKHYENTLKFLLKHEIWLIDKDKYDSKNVNISKPQAVDLITNDYNDVKLCTNK
jgi:hypothetical protein